MRCGVVQLQSGGGVRDGAGSVGILRFLRVCHSHENIARIGHDAWFSRHMHGIVLRTYADTEPNRERHLRR